MLINFILSVGLRRKTKAAARYNSMVVLPSCVDFQQNDVDVSSSFFVLSKAKKKRENMGTACFELRVF